MFALGGSKSTESSHMTSIFSSLQWEVKYLVGPESNETFTSSMSRTCVPRSLRAPLDFRTQCCVCSPHKFVMHLGITLTLEHLLPLGHKQGILKSKWEPAWPTCCCKHPCYHQCLRRRKTAIGKAGQKQTTNPFCKRLQLVFLDLGSAEDQVWVSWVCGLMHGYWAIPQSSGEK
jgi:hypothetical protein